MNKTVKCPYCAELIDIFIDTSEVSQTYIEDCSVCCRPIEVTYRFDGGAKPAVRIKTLND